MRKVDFINDGVFVFAKALFFYIFVRRLII